MTASFELQGHRGARGLKPENTLPGFETALDLAVSSIETDVHLTRDQVPVLLHDPVISSALFRRIPGAAPEPARRPRVSTLTLAQLRSYRADRNPDPARFPNQENAVSPLASWFAAEHGIDPYAPPTLAELFAFVAAYAGTPGERAGKSLAQRQAAGRLRFDLELKRVPFHPEFIDDGWTGTGPGVLERQLVEAIQEAGVRERTAVRSFDHRCLLALRQLEPTLPTGILLADTAPVSPGQLARQADAQYYCPSFTFLDEVQVRQAHAEGLRVLPWTVNESDAWKQLLDWGVDGITTDFPDRLARLLRERGIVF